MRLLDHMQGESETFSKENLEGLWIAYERNKDGQLNLSEVRALCQEMVQTEKTRAMQEVNSNSSRRMEAWDRLKNIERVEQTMDDRFMENVTHQLDINHDGRVTKEEFMQMAPSLFDDFGQSGKRKRERDGGCNQQ